MTIWRAIFVSGRMADHVHDLEARLFRRHDRFLAGDQDHRHRAEMGIGRAGREVERAGPERRDAHAGAAGQTPMRCCHEGCRLLVAGEDQLDLRLAQRFDHMQVLLPGDAEDALDPLILERSHQKI